VIAIIFNAVVNFALGVYVVLIGIATWRVLRGENVIDRLIGVDLIGMLLLGVLIIVSMIYQEGFYLDVALGLAAMGFVGTLALARYFADEQMF
jgi:multisubunit Na+/H+ antiporter MnhF subunit